MGITLVKLIVKNPFDLKKEFKEEFLVDSGAHYTVLPEKAVKFLGIKPSWTQDFALADGKVVKRQVGNAYIKFQDKEAPVPVVLGKKGDSALLGVTTLETFGLMLDPFTRKLYHSKLMLG